MFNIAVLSSGMSRGSNLLAIAEYFRLHNLPVKIMFVIRTKEEAPIAEVCQTLNIACHYLPYKDRLKFEEKVLYLLNYHEVHLLALAGFLKQLSSEFIDTCNIPVLNIHPALLPHYGGAGMYGMNVHKAIFKAGDKTSGATVHLVDDKYDHGQIVAQQQVDISICNSPEEIAHTVLEVEHQLYGKAIWSYLQKLYS